MHMCVFVCTYTPNFIIYSSFDGQLNCCFQLVLRLSKCPTVSTDHGTRGDFSAVISPAQSLFWALWSEDYRRWHLYSGWGFKYIKKLLFFLLMLMWLWLLKVRKNALKHIWLVSTFTALRDLAGHVSSQSVSTRRALSLCTGAVSLYQKQALSSFLPDSEAASAPPTDKPPTWTLSHGVTLRCPLAPTHKVPFFRH